ncbi:MAG: hypothetical protein ABIT16_13695 [Croceibacterium sp.]
MLNRDGAEHPVPYQLRSTFRQIAAAFADADYRLHHHPIEGVAAVDEETATRIADNVAAYGDALAPLDEATWNHSVYRWMDGHWLILVDLTTNREPVSDLTLHAKLHEASGLLELDSLHVP